MAIDVIDHDPARRHPGQVAEPVVCRVVGNCRPFDDQKFIAAAPALVAVRCMHAYPCKRWAWRSGRAFAATLLKAGGGVTLAEPQPLSAPTNGFSFHPPAVKRPGQLRHGMLAFFIEAVAQCQYQTNKGRGQQRPECKRFEQKGAKSPA